MIRLKLAREGAVDFGLKAFKLTELGRKVEPVLEGPQNIRDMIALCRHGMPATRVVGKQLLALGIKPADDETKKMIGRWIREIMERQGWTVWRPGKVPRGNLFSTGMIYRPRDATK
jgi:hypothetical protein